MSESHILRWSLLNEDIEICSFIKGICSYISDETRNELVLPLYNLLRQIALVYNNENHFDQSHEVFSTRDIVEMVMSLLVWNEYNESLHYSSHDNIQQYFDYISEFKFVELNHHRQMMKLDECIRYFMTSVINISAFSTLFKSILADYQICHYSSTGYCITYVLDPIKYNNDREQLINHVHEQLCSQINTMVEKYDITTIRNILRLLDKTFENLPYGIFRKEQYIHRTDIMYEDEPPENYSHDFYDGTLKYALNEVIDKAFENIYRVSDSLLIRMIQRVLNNYSIPEHIVEHIYTHYFTIQHMNTTRSDIESYIDTIRYLEQWFCR